MPSASWPRTCHCCRIRTGRLLGHSLRAGLATSVVQAGVSTLKIRDQTGHVSDAMLAWYVRDSELILDNAAGALYSVALTRPLG